MILQNAELVTDARSVRAMRDENDILKERAFKATRLENELDMLKDKVKDIEFYKQRLSEIREDNKYALLRNYHALSLSM